jgi:hypothetical protein
MKQLKLSKKLDDISDAILMRVAPLPPMPATEKCNDCCWRDFEWKNLIADGMHLLK